MKAWSTLERAVAPDGAELTLQQRGREFAIRAGGQVLMGSRSSGSERALAEATCPRLRPDARVLIGGLGLGFTLRAALDCLGPAATVSVAELVPAVVGWNRGPLGPLADSPLADRRVTVFPGDVREAWRAAAPLDAILLDVDNGPTALTRPANGALYSEAGLREARAALRPGGVLGVWSAGPAPAFLARLARCGFEAEERSGGTGRHALLLGWKPGRTRAYNAWSEAAPRIKERTRDSIQPRAPGHRRRRR
jgi:hypothetical protein